MRVIRNLFHEQGVDGDAEEAVCSVLGFGAIFWLIVSSRLVWPRRAITSNVSEWKSELCGAWVERRFPGLIDEGRHHRSGLSGRSFMWV